MKGEAHERHIPKTIEQAIEKGASVSLMIRENKKNLKLCLAILIEKTLFDFSQEWNEQQIYSAVEKIVVKYWFLKIDEIAYVFDKAVTGEYGQVYGKVTVSTLMMWLHKYDVEDRITYIQTKNSATKETYDHNRVSLQEDESTVELKKVKEKFIKSKFNKNVKK